MKIVKITWLDHTTYELSDWHDKDEFLELAPMTAVTVGHLLKETKTAYYVAATLLDDEQVAGEFLILKGTVQKVEVL